MLDTQRLLLRPFSIADAASLLQLNNDEEVIRYTGDPPFHDLKDAQRFVLHYDHYNQHGHGRYSVLSKDQGLFLGWCGLKVNSSGEVDLGYRFHKFAWGKGYATEAGEACLEEGFTKFGYKRIIGRVMVPNIGSTRVLQKLGFSFDKYIYCGGEISEQWEIVHAKK